MQISGKTKFQTTQNNTLASESKNCIVSYSILKNLDKQNIKLKIFFYGEFNGIATIMGQQWNKRDIVNWLWIDPSAHAQKTADSTDYRIFHTFRLNLFVFSYAEVKLSVLSYIQLKYFNQK